MRRQRRRRVAMVLICSVLFLFALCTASCAQSFIPEWIHSVSADHQNDIRDDAFLAKFLESLRCLSVKPHHGIHPTVSNWIGGGLYWEFAIDTVPYDPASDSLWSTINTATANQK
jgi:hypothetical protein